MKINVIYGTAYFNIFKAVSLIKGIEAIHKYYL